MDFRTFLQHLGGRLFSNDERRKLHDYHKDTDSQFDSTLPAMIVLGVFKSCSVQHIRWAAGVVALIDVAAFQTQLFYYESVWLVLFFLVIQLAITGLLSVWLYKKYGQT